MHFVYVTPPAKYLLLIPLLQYFPPIFLSFFFPPSLFTFSSLVLYVQCTALNKGHRMTIWKITALPVVSASNNLGTRCIYFFSICLHCFQASPCKWAGAKRGPFPLHKSQHHPAHPRDPQKLKQTDLSCYFIPFYWLHWDRKLVSIP